MRRVRSLYEEAEAVTVKGKSAPLRVWLALGARRSGRAHAQSVPMLAASSELAVLERIWERVVDERRPQLVTVLGDAGIGKTRLLRNSRSARAREASRAPRPLAAVWRNTLYGPFTTR